MQACLKGDFFNYNLFIIRDKRSKMGDLPISCKSLPALPPLFSLLNLNCLTYYKMFYEEIISIKKNNYDLLFFVITNVSSFTSH